MLNHSAIWQTKYRTNHTTVFEEYKEQNRTNAIDMIPKKVKHPQQTLAESFTAKMQ